MRAIAAGLRQRHDEMNTCGVQPHRQMADNRGGRVALAN
ncbi:hypothetical protein DDI_3608 [Dickeya dianthicola RNS04.9]|nr:hypothetical protein DDI_3608 [Dickeya dianthicola RNS04.9]